MTEPFLFIEGTEIVGWQGNFQSKVSKELKRLSAKSKEHSQQIAELQLQNKDLQGKVTQIMSELEDVTTAVHSAEDRLDKASTTLTGLRDTVAKLQAQIDAGSNDPALTSLATELNGHIAAFDAALNPPAPPAAPATPPTDASGIGQQSS